ncbi:MAG: MaoC family dehydratase [Robiginitomaculum sp.]
MSEFIRGYYLDEMEVGMAFEKSMETTEEAIETFAKLSGDYNPIHMDAEYAKTTMFGQRIAHGALSASLISAVLGNDLPGPGAIFVELNMRFRKPAFIGDIVVARAEVAEINQRTGRIKMKVRCSVNGKPIIRGDAGVIVPKRPEGDTSKRD